MDFGVNKLASTEPFMDESKSHFASSGCSASKCGQFFRRTLCKKCNFSSTPCLYASIVAHPDCVDVPLYRDGATEKSLTTT